MCVCVCARLAAAASLAGSVGVYVVGAVLDATHSWALVLSLASLCNFVCVSVYILFATSDPIFD